VERWGNVRRDLRTAVVRANARLVADVKRAVEADGSHPLRCPKPAQTVVYLRQRRGDGSEG